jgi:hypothetical protein
MIYVLGIRRYLPISKRALDVVVDLRKRNKT